MQLGKSCTSFDGDAPLMLFIVIDGIEAPSNDSLTRLLMWSTEAGCHFPERFLAKTKGCASESNSETC
jgi:hypothetical protein